MNKVFATATLLAAAVAASLPRQDVSTESSACTVQAWVRAEDLAPDHVSHGELRIKVLQPHCAHSIASVTLRLELNEFGEVKHLRPGAVIPEIKKTDNQTLRDDPSTLYDYGPYDKAMSDSDLWFVKAEERTVWSTEVTLFENNLSLSSYVTEFQ
ncbi:hypothetical protein K438DRAFT_1618501 [Mycena galopus ATCC 62051]|nr:hypothetical protein K438DRAFT_1618501 [Mycena galopus ATCC 62051]